jgi:predicted  nucleic acid-binding Zn-ribbon protein
MDVRKSLVDLRARLARAREDLRITEEQLRFQADVAAEAETRMLVSETPIADREFRTARDDLARLERQRAKVAAEIAELERECDRLLDRMLEPRA